VSTGRGAKFAKSRGKFAKNGDYGALIVEFRATAFGSTFAQATTMLGLENETHRGPWAVILAGGDGTRLQKLTSRIAGDSRPKQFCRLFGNKSLLRQTRERLRPVFRENRTMFVVTRAHEAFYKDELSDAPGSNLVVQPANRGTGVAIAVAVLQILRHDPDGIVAFFPSDHYFADEAGFQATVRSAIALATQHPESLILVGAAPRWPEVEYGWIEPGREIMSAEGISVRRVSRFWEKPALGTARQLMHDGGLWNTFVTIGHSNAFLDLLMSTVPAVVSEIAVSPARRDMDRAYRAIDLIDFSKHVLSPHAQRLLVIPDGSSGWTDLGNENRVLGMLVENQIEPEWLQDMLQETPLVSEAIS
jgi:mannose-1-phosphate guanylyltransferase